MKPWTFADAVREARKRGWVRCGGRGSHQYFRKAGTGVKICIPNHRGDLKPGLQRQIMRQLGIAPDQL